MPDSTTSASVTTILRPWVGKPAGLFYEAYVAMTQWADYGSQSTVNNQVRVDGISDFLLIISYIASAKNSLTKDVKKLLIDSQYGWIAGLVTKDQLAKIVEKGASMTQDEFDTYIKKDRKLVGTRFDKTALGMDGLNAEEIIRFLRVGRHMGVTEEELNNILIAYFQESSLMQTFADDFVTPTSKL